MFELTACLLNKGVIDIAIIKYFRISGNSQTGAEGSQHRKKYTFVEPQYTILAAQRDAFRRSAGKVATDKRLIVFLFSGIY